MKVLRESTRTTDVVLAIGIVIFLGLTALNFYVVTTNVEYDKEYLALSSDLRVLSQSISKNATEASGGQTEAFGLLKSARDRFQHNLTLLKEGDPSTGLPASPESVQGPLADVDKLWATFRENADKILSREELVLSLKRVVEAFNSVIPKLQSISDDVIGILIQKGASQRQVYIGSRQLVLTERIARNVNQALQSDLGAATAAEHFRRDTALFGSVLSAMLEGNRRMKIDAIVDPDARAKLEKMKSLYGTLNGYVGEILEASPELFEEREAANTMSGTSDKLLGLSGTLVQAYSQVEAERPIYEKVVAGLAAAGVAVVLIVALFFLRMREDRQRAAATAEENRRNQEAILRLLDEMGDLADGDLTVHATVTEDFTGAIADSINYTIDALRDLVSTINETAVQVSSAAQETQATAMHLAEASDHQAQEIAGASAAVNEMAVSIEQVSSNAVESAAVAKNSVAHAVRGAEAVQNTIHGMDTIREQIQETSKRIKRLGESSQEIGDIVGLINDIADQTNILALNAAIQAAMAGEAGRGFAVVADEVQRLAERSGNATKQIEALVKTIQSDTNEAVISMEQSTSQVVAGAKLAQGAGEALEQIENVSKHLADLIGTISNAAGQQSAAAANISNTMNVIQEITTQTSSGTNETAVSIGNLADLANELRKSVAGFKLPE